MSLIAIAFQDIKERQVYWFLFPLVTVICAVLHYNSVLPEQFSVSLVLNFVFVGSIVLIIYAYTRLKMKAGFNTVIGLGDILLFVAFAFAFATISFILIFIFSLIFSLILHLFLSRKSKDITVPLAGYVSLFFMMTYVSYWLGFTNGLYSI